MVEYDCRRLVGMLSCVTPDKDQWRDCSKIWYIINMTESKLENAGLSWSASWLCASLKYCQSLSACLPFQHHIKIAFTAACQTHSEWKWELWQQNVKLEADNMSREERSRGLIIIRSHAAARCRQRVETLQNQKLVFLSNLVGTHPWYCEWAWASDQPWQRAKTCSHMGRWMQWVGILRETFL